MTHCNYSTAYRSVHSRAVLSNLARSFLYSDAASATSGSSGFGSVNRDNIDNNTFAQAHRQSNPCVNAIATQHAARVNIHTFDTVMAGLHFSFKMSMQMEPSGLMLGWYTFVRNRTFIGLNGYLLLRPPKRTM